MTERTKRIRAAVEALRQLDESDWAIIDKILNSKKILMLANFDEKEKKINKILKDFGIPLQLLGYNYIKTAIYYVIENKDRKLFITKDINPYVAEKFETTPSNAERAIRSAIDIAWKKGDREIHYKIFGYSIKEKLIKPSNFEAIKALSQYIIANVF